MLSEISDVLKQMAFVIVPLLAIGSIKLLAFAVWWNYQKINGFIKKKDYASSGGLARVRRTQELIRLRRLQREKNQKRKTDSANWLAIITNPFNSIGRWIAEILTRWFK